jgi:Family of unknown function (DUF6176)
MSAFIRPRASWLPKTRTVLVAITFLGLGVCLSRIEIARPAVAVSTEADDKPRYPLRMRLYRYEMNPGKADRFDEWMRFLESQNPAVLQSLERERMYVEGIFRDRERDKEVVYWLTVAAEGGGTSSDSPLEIDKAHMAFLREVIKKGGRTDLTTESFLVAPSVRDAIAAQQQRGLVKKSEAQGPE